MIEETNILIKYEEGFFAKVIVQGYTKFYSLFSLTLKNAGGFFDQKKNCNFLSITHIESFITALKKEASIIPSMSLRIKLNPIDLLSQIPTILPQFIELDTSRSKSTFDFTLLKKPPIKGKHPYENFQSDDIAKASNQNRFGFLWDVGLGKSFALAYLMERLFQQNKISKCLILTTKIGVKNLKKELLLFSPTLKEDDIFCLFSIADLKDKENRAIFTKYSDKKVVVLSYSVLRVISDYYYELKNSTKTKKVSGRGKKYRKSPLPIKEWLGNKEGILMLDESHWIGSPLSKQTIIIKNILEYFYYRYLFTGTFATKPEKMYMQTYAIDKFLTGYMDYNQWCCYYNETGNKWSEYAINNEKWRYERVDALNNLLVRKYVSKRKAEDVLELKENIDVEPIIIDMSDKHRKIYQNFVQEYFEILQNNLEEYFEELGGKAAKKTSLSRMVLSNIMAFQSICDHPHVSKRNSHYNKLSEYTRKIIENFDYEKHNAKLEFLEEIIEDRVENSDERGIIWVAHAETLRDLDEHFKKYPHTIVGAGCDPIQVTNEFINDKEKKFIIASILVMNTSVTLTECKWNCFIESTYNVNDLIQALGRIRRIGQTDITRNYRILFDNSLDLLQYQNFIKGGLLLDSIGNKTFIKQEDWSNIFTGRLTEYI
jgi:hypothetical protein